MAASADDQQMGVGLPRPIRIGTVSSQNGHFMVWNAGTYCTSQKKHPVGASAVNIGELQNSLTAGLQTTNESAGVILVYDDIIQMYIVKIPLGGFWCHSALTSYRRHFKQLPNIPRPAKEVGGV